MKKTSTFILLFLCSIFAFSQKQFNQELLAHAQNAPYHVSLDIALLTKYLCQIAKTDSDKIELFYYWLAENIAYDTESYVSGTYNDCTAQTTLSTQKAVCQGYSELFMAMCNEAGIKCHLVNGYAKGFGYIEGHRFDKTNHAWNAVYTGGKWQLLDATWGAGYVGYEGDRLVFHKKLKMEDFLAKPEEFVKRHLPANPIWQLLHYPVTMAEYLDETFEIGKKNGEFLNFNDSISEYFQLPEEERKIKEAESKHRFFPVDPDALALAYYNYAVRMSTENRETYALNKSIQYYQKAKAIYQNSTDPKAAQMLQYCDQGIEYAEFYLNH